VLAGSGVSPSVKWLINPHWINMRFRIILLLFLIAVASGTAMTADWKYVGKTIVQHREYYAFYDDSSRHAGGDQIVSIELKLLRVHQVDSTIEANPKAFVRLVTERIRSHYLPPYIRAKADTSTDLVIAITQREVAANTMDQKLGRHISCDIECLGRLIRTTSWSITEPGEKSEVALVTEPLWEEISSQSFGEPLLELVCSNQ
jgi:hypothetical protein